MSISENWGKSLPGELLSIWPKDSSGNPEKPALLCTRLSLDMDDELMINMLGAYGIPCLKQYVGNGGFGKLILGMSGEGVEIYVPETLLEEAKALIASEPVEEE